MMGLRNNYQFVMKGYSPDPVRDDFFVEFNVSEEMMKDSGTREIVLGEGTRQFHKLLNELVDEDVSLPSRAIDREKVWERVKNVNTDEELEEIRELLGVEK